MNWVSEATLVATIANVFIMPFILRGLQRQNDDRSIMRNEMIERLTHLDQCLDDLQRRVLGELATRSELLSNRSDVNEIMNRMRTAISQETHGLHERILRLEDLQLHKGRQG